MFISEDKIKSTIQHYSVDVSYDSGSVLDDISQSSVSESVLRTSCLPSPHVLAKPPLILSSEDIPSD